MPFQTNISTGEAITGSDFVARALHLARRLLSYGSRKGDVIAIFSPNSIDWMLVFSAAFRIGTAVAGINHLLRSGKIFESIPFSWPKRPSGERTDDIISLKTKKKLFQISFIIAFLLRVSRVDVNLLRTCFKCRYLKLLKYGPVVFKFVLHVTCKLNKIHTYTRV